MMFFGRKKATAAPLAKVETTSSKSIPSFWGSRGEAAPAPDCAVWNDIARALDAKPRSASK